MVLTEPGAKSADHSGQFEQTIWANSTNGLGAPAGGWVLPHATVDGLADEVRLARVAAVLLDQVAHDPAQADRLTELLRESHLLVEATLLDPDAQPLAGTRDRAVVPRVELLGTVARRGGELPVDVVVPARCPPTRRGISSPSILTAVAKSSWVARCLRSPPRVSDDGPRRVSNPAASSSSALKRNVQRSRSSAPRTCSTSEPENGGSHGVSVGLRVGLSLMAPTVRAVPDVRRPEPRACLRLRRTARSRC